MLYHALAVICRALDDASVAQQHAAARSSTFLQKMCVTAATAAQILHASDTKVARLVL
jgi:hypothetical protein